MPDLKNRRPLASRQTRLAQGAARWLTARGASPDAISAAGILAALLAGAALAFASAHPALWLAGAVCVQLRLLANLLDGMVAVEGGRGGPLGPLWNEAPDRIEDVAILYGFGLAAGAPLLGLWTCVAALLTAYLRVLGGSLGLPQSFVGPMAKQHRMAAVTAGSGLGLIEALAGGGWGLPRLVLMAILAGAILTAARRSLGIAAELRERG